jgi:hypothetical protein
MNATPFQATETLAAIRARRRIARRRPYRHSRLERYRAELVELRRAGASYAELTDWLRQKRIRVCRSTVLRYLAKLPELMGADHAQLC